MTPSIEEQTRRWQAFAAQVAQLALDQGIDGIAMAGLIQYADPPTGGITVMAYCGLSSRLNQQQTTGVGWAVVDGVRAHFYRSASMLEAHP